jgi:endonuclease YncB( thermonuclease family)
LNAQTLQGKVVRVADGDTITVLDEAMVKKVVPKPITFEDFRKQKKGIVR